MPEPRSKFADNAVEGILSRHVCLGGVSSSRRVQCVRNISIHMRHLDFGKW